MRRLCWRTRTETNNPVAVRRYGEAHARLRGHSSAPENESGAPTVAEKANMSLKPLYHSTRC